MYAGIVEHSSIAHVKLDERTVIAVLDELACTVVSAKSLLAAYKLLSDAVHPDKQYLSCGWHFLVKKPECAYMAYTYYGLDIDIPSKIEGNEPILAIIHNYLSSNASNGHCALCMALCKEYEGNLELSSIMACYQARVPSEWPVSAITKNQMYLASDWLEPLEYDDQLPQLVVARIRRLKVVLPLFYFDTLHSRYSVVVNAMYEKHSLVHLSLADIQFLLGEFPLFDSSQLDDARYKLLLMDVVLAGYYLGLPIHIEEPTRERIQQAYSKYRELGVDAYCAGVTAANQRAVLSALRTGLLAGNEENVLMEPVWSYSPYDIVVQVHGKHYYTFTRPEFKDILVKKKNYWNNRDMTPQQLAYIRGRLGVGLPKSRPLRQLLDEMDGETEEVEENHVVVIAYMGC
jgi:hypothetical protein